MDVPPQDAHAGGMEGGRPYILSLRPQHPFQTLLQLPCRLVGEGDGQDGPRRGRVNFTEHLRPLGHVLLRVAQVAGQKLHVLRRDPIGHLHAAGVTAPTEADEVGDAVDEHGGLAAAGARQEQQGAFGGEGAQALLLVEVLVVPGDDLASHLAKLRLLCLI